MTERTSPRRRLWTVAASLCALPSVIAGAAPLEEAGWYHEHRLVAVTLADATDIETMLRISGDHWTEAVGVGTLPFRVPPERMWLLDASGLEYRLLHANIQDLVDAEREAMQHAGRGWFDNYRSYDSISGYIDTLIGVQPDLVTRYVLGESVLGQEIHGFTISSPAGPAEKPAILFNGTQHAREWISPMTVMFIADKLVQGYGSDPRITQLLDACDFHIVPVVNPDGYEYSRNSQRLWRKNRQFNSDGTRGVDNNRNWGFRWGGQGSGSAPGSETYRGTAPFSEPENRAMRDFILDHAEIVAHIDFHSYSQLILSPWSHTEDEPEQPDRDLFRALNASMESAIEATHGKDYRSGPGGKTLYLASGVAPDWSYGERGILAWTVELRDTGHYGFVLPPSQIIPTAEEAFQGALALGEYVAAPIFYAFPKGLPEYITPRVGQPVAISLFSELQTIDPSSPTLWWRSLGSDAFRPAQMQYLGGPEYAALLPVLPCGAELEYYFEAATIEGVTVRSPEAAPATTYQATAILRAMLIDDLETDQGWIVGDGGDDASEGVWTRVDPIGTDFFGPYGAHPQPEDDHTEDGTMCFVTGQGEAGGGPGDADVDGGQTTLVSPQFDATDGEATIRYWRWFYAEHDDLTIDLSNDGGQSWMNLETIAGSSSEARGNWFEFSRPLSQIGLPATTNMRLRFVARDEDADGIVEAAVDDLDIWALSACQPPCFGDLDGDGEIGQGDLGVLLAAYGVGWEGDLDWDGDTDQADLGSLLAIYGQPCD
jgi:murein tripeptide amidase MpaA